MSARPTIEERFDAGYVVQIRGEGWPHVPLAQAILIAEQHAAAEVAAHQSAPDPADPDGWVRRSALNHWHGRATAAESEVAALRAERAEVDALNGEEYDRIIRERDDALAQLAARCDQVEELQQRIDEVCVAVGSHCASFEVVQRVAALRAEVERLRKLLDEGHDIVREHACGYTVWIEAAGAALEVQP